MYTRNEVKAAVSTKFQTYFMDQNNISYFNVLVIYCAYELMNTFRLLVSLMCIWELVLMK